MEEKNVLLVEDDPALRSVVSDILADAGYRPIAISDHSEIAASLDHWRPRCVILDGVDKWTGDSHSWAYAEWIRSTHPQLPVVILTVDGASLAEARAPRSLAAAFAGIISKPFEVEEFLATVQRAVDTDAP